MSEQKWAVMSSVTGSWGVASPEHAYREDDGLLACTEWESLHDTWAEAMQEVDRMTRTVTVTLPRLAPGKWTAAGGFQVIPESPGCGDALEVDEIDPDGEYFILDKEDCEPLALALLAHARGLPGDNR